MTKKEASKTADKIFRLEIWDQSSGRTHMKKLDHKDNKFSTICTNSTFGGFVWNSSGTKIAFTAEAKVEKSAEYLNAETEDELNTAGNAHDWKESWGELL